MKDPNNKLVPLPSPDERQRVSKEHRLTLMISNLLPVFGQVIMVMVLRCYVSGADWISPSNAIIFTLLLVAMMFESWGSLNLLAPPGQGPVCRCDGGARPRRGWDGNLLPVLPDYYRERNRGLWCEHHQGLHGDLPWRILLSPARLTLLR